MISSDRRRYDTTHACFVLSPMRKHAELFLYTAEINDAEQKRVGSFLLPSVSGDFYLSSMYLVPAWSARLKTHLKRSRGGAEQA